VTAPILLRTLILMAAAAVSTVPAVAQTVDHDVSVVIPTTIGIRMVGAGTGPRAVDFGYAEGYTSYLSAAETGMRLPPTAVSRFDDIEVNVNGFGLWSVYVEATAFAYSGSGNGTGLELADIRLDRGSTSGLTQNAITTFWFFGSYDATWTLSSNPQRIARSLLGTGGWRSLGFNGWDYSLAVDGDEEAGTYTTTVTYYLTFP